MTTQIQLNRNCVMEFALAGATNQLKEQRFHLYDPASRYESARTRIKELTEQIRDSLNQVEQGYTPWYSVSQKAVELELKMQEANEAKRTFEAMAKLLGLEVVTAEEGA